jgi:Tfp pilus assembly PilM family ATPase
LAQVERAGAHLRLAHARVIQRGSAAGENGSPVPASQWWSEIFRSKALGDGFSGRRAACVLSASETDVRAMNIPEGAEAERRAMIAGEIEAMYAGSTASRAFDFWETRPQSAASESSLESVNVVSVAEDEAVEVAASLARSGLLCAVLDGLPMTLARAVQLASVSPPETPVAALDWGGTSATFCIVCDGRPVFTRQLRDCGFSAVPAAIAEAMGLSVDDAGELLATHGLGDPAGCDEVFGDVQEILTDIASEPLGAVIAELDKTLSYPELHRSRLLPETIWLFGGGATIRNVSAVLSDRIGVPVQTWDLPQAAGEATTGPSSPVQLLGPAIALSALAWTP